MGHINFDVFYFHSDSIRARKTQNTDTLLAVFIVNFEHTHDNIEYINLVFFY